MISMILLESLAVLGGFYILFIISTAFALLIIHDLEHEKIRTELKNGAYLSMIMISLPSMGLIDVVLEKFDLRIISKEKLEKYRALNEEIDYYIGREISEVER